MCVHDPSVNNRPEVSNTYFKVKMKKEDAKEGLGSKKR